MPRGASSLGFRFAHTRATKRAFGITGSLLAVLVAVAACELAERGHPTALAIGHITRRSTKNLVPELVARGLLAIVDRDPVTRIGVYGVTRRGWETLEIEKGFV